MKINYCPNCGASKEHLETRPEGYHIGWLCTECDKYFNVLTPAFQD